MPKAIASVGDASQVEKPGASLSGHLMVAVTALQVLLDTPEADIKNLPLPEIQKLAKAAQQVSDRLYEASETDREIASAMEMISDALNIISGTLPPPKRAARKAPAVKKTAVQRRTR